MIEHDCNTGETKLDSNKRIFSLLAIACGMHTKTGSGSILYKGAEKKQCDHNLFTMLRQMMQLDALVILTN